jgi:hypothetical protein
MAALLRAIRRTARQVEQLAGLLEVPGAENRVEKQTDFSNCPRPVLLLHGWFSARRTFDVLERRLRRDGYGVFSLDLGSASTPGTRRSGRSRSSATRRAGSSPRTT